jgi:hypothetical protein
MSINSATTVRYVDLCLSLPRSFHMIGKNPPRRRSTITLGGERRKRQFAHFSRAVAWPFDCNSHIMSPTARPAASSRNFRIGHSAGKHSRIGGNARKFSCKRGIHRVRRYKHHHSRKRNCSLLDLAILSIYYDDNLYKQCNLPAQNPCRAGCSGP